MHCLTRVPIGRSLVGNYQRITQLAKLSSSSTCDDELVAPLRRRRSQLWMAAAEESDSAAAGSRDDAVCDKIVDRLAALVSQHRRTPLSSAELHQLLQAAATSAAALLLDEGTIHGMRVDELKAHLTASGLNTRGRKAELVERLLAARSSETAAAPKARAPTAPRVAKAAVAAPAPAAAAASEGAPELRRQELSTALLDRLAGLTDPGVPRNGPQTGVFTDGSANPNPGPGGWGVVAVRDGEVLWAERGSAPQTTNNRMELSAIIAALRRLGEDEAAVIYSDSKLCVQTLTVWAAGWERHNWRRQGGKEPVQNVDLVREAYSLTKRRTGVRFEWIRAHAGSTWNEYADRLAGWREL